MRDKFPKLFSYIEDRKISGEQEMLFLMSSSSEEVCGILSIIESALHPNMLNTHARRGNDFRTDFCRRADHRPLEDVLRYPKEDHMNRHSLIMSAAMNLVGSLSPYDLERVVRVTDRNTEYTRIYETDVALLFLS